MEIDPQAYFILNELEEKIKRTKFNTNCDEYIFNEKLMYEKLLDDYEKTISDMYDNIIMPYINNTPENVFSSTILVKSEYMQYMFNNIPGLRYLLLLSNIYDRFKYDEIKNEEHENNYDV